MAGGRATCQWPWESPPRSTSWKARDELTVAILTGAAGTFCAGIDLKAFVRGESPSIPGGSYLDVKHISESDHRSRDFAVLQVAVGLVYLGEINLARDEVIQVEPTLQVQIGV